LQPEAAWAVLEEGQAGRGEGERHDKKKERNGI